MPALSIPPLVDITSIKVPADGEDELERLVMDTFLHDVRVCFAVKEGLEPYQFMEFSKRATQHRYLPNSIELHLPACDTLCDFFSRL